MFFNVTVNPKVYNLVCPYQLYFWLINRKNFIIIIYTNNVGIYIETLECTSILKRHF